MVRFILFKDNNVIGFGILLDGLYNLKLDNKFVESLHVLYNSAGIKRNMLNENSAYLWHRCLGYVSKEILERLVKKGILSNLDFY